MPSGISHMLLSRRLPIEEESPYFHRIRQNTRYFQFGSIAPDLPYGAIADDNFLENQDRIANLFHFTEEGQSPDLGPNQLPLLGFRQAKNLLNNGTGKRECDALFWFLAGYSSHVIADGICHPFVMDKVGRYEGANKAEHRALEMGIDVLLLKHLTSASGHRIEASYAGMDDLIDSFNELRYTAFVFENFTGLISEVYGVSVSTSQIGEWVNGISRLLSLSTGKWPGWLRNLDATTPFVFRQISDLDARGTEYLELGKPKFWDDNFLHRPSVNFIDDCLPLFDNLMKSFLDKAYAYVYESGSALRDEDLPAFSLDTGRTVSDPDNIDLKPLLWEVA